LPNRFKVAGPATVGGSNDLTFIGPGFLTGPNILTINNTAGTVTFQGILSGEGGLTKSGMGNLILAIGDNYTGPTHINTGTLLAAGVPSTSAVTVALGGTLDLNSSKGAIGSLAGAGTVSLGVALLTTGADNTSTAFSGIISGIGGSLIKTGTGTFALSGANTYTGMTIINAGTLQLEAATAIPPAASITVAAGATLDLNNFRATIDALAGAGNVTLGIGSLSTGGDDTSSAFHGIISGNGNLIKIGTGTLALAGANAYTGGTRLLAGTLIVGNDSALGSGTLTLEGGILQASSAVNLANSFAVEGAATVGGNNKLTFSGTGTATVANTLMINNTGTTIFAGLLSGQLAIIENAGTGMLALFAANTYVGGTTLIDGTLDVRAAGLGTGGLVLDGGTLTGDGAPGTTIANPYMVGGPATIQGDVRTLRLTLTGPGTLTTGNTLTVRNSFSTITLSGLLSGGGSLTKEDFRPGFPGTLVLSGVNIYTGATTVDSGILQLGTANAIPKASSVTVANGATLDLNNFSDTIGSLEGVGNVALGTGSLTTGANNASTTFSGVITGNGRLITTGTAMFILDGANTYTGGTTLISGTLIVGSDSALGSGMLTLQGGTLQARSPVSLANPISIGAPAQVGGSNDIAFTGPVLLNGSILEVDNTAGTVTFNAVLSGGGGLLKDGAGNLILAIANTYTGPTRINTGTLLATGIPSTSAVTVASGATLDLNNANAAIGSLAGEGTVTVGSAILTTGGDNTSTGFSGIIRGIGGLTKIGTKTFTLTGSSIYTGATTVMAGALVVNGSQPGSNVTVSSGATLAGAGTVGIIIAAGAVNPGPIGSGTAILRSGNAIFNAGSTFTVTLNGTTAGTGFDQLNVGGTVDLTESPTLHLTIGFVASLGDTFVIITSSKSLTGTFTGIADNSTVSSDGQTFRVNYTANAVTLTRTALPIAPPTPAPSLPPSTKTPGPSGIGAGLVGLTESGASQPSAQAVNGQARVSSGTALSDIRATESRSPSAPGGLGSGSDEIAGQRNDVRTGDLLSLRFEPGLPGRNDIVSGIDLAGSLLTGVRPTPTLQLQKGTSFATVATVVPGAAGDEHASPTDPSMAQESIWPNFVIGLDDTIHRRPVVAPEKTPGMSKAAEAPQKKLAVLDRTCEPHLSAPDEIVIPVDQLGGRSLPRPRPSFLAMFSPREFMAAGKLMSSDSPLLHAITALLRAGTIGVLSRHIRTALGAEPASNAAGGDGVAPQTAESIGRGNEIPTQDTSPRAPVVLEAIPEQANGRSRMLGSIIFLAGISQTCAAVAKRKSARRRCTTLPDAAGKALYRPHFPFRGGRPAGPGNRDGGGSRRFHPRIRCVPGLGKELREAGVPQRGRLVGRQRQDARQDCQDQGSGRAAPDARSDRPRHESDSLPARRAGA
jgi:autotransporter-associated beta strand protein